MIDMTRGRISLEFHMFGQKSTTATSKNYRERSKSDSEFLFRRGVKRRCEEDLRAMITTRTRLEARSCILSECLEE